MRLFASTNEKMCTPPFVDESSRSSRQKLKTLGNNLASQNQ